MRCSSHCLLYSVWAPSPSPWYGAAHIKRTSFILSCFASSAKLLWDTVLLHIAIQTVTTNFESESALFCLDHLNPVPITGFLPYAGSSMKTLWPWRTSMRAPPTTTWSCSCKWRWLSPPQRPRRGGGGENSCQMKSRTSFQGSETLSFGVVVLPVKGWGAILLG